MLIATEDFQHILRLLNTNIDGKHKTVFAMKSIIGVGRRYANIEMNKRAGELKPDEQEHLMLSGACVSKL